MNKCKGPECDKAVSANGLCPGHNSQQYQGKSLTPLRVYKKRPEGPAGFFYCNGCEAFKREAEFRTYKSGKPKSRCIDCERAASLANYYEKYSPRAAHR